MSPYSFETTALFISLSTGELLLIVTYEFIESMTKHSLKVVSEYMKSWVFSFAPASPEKNKYLLPKEVFTAGMSPDSGSLIKNNPATCPFISAISKVANADLG